MEKLGQLKVLTNQLAWHEKFFVFFGHLFFFEPHSVISLTGGTDTGTAANSEAGECLGFRSAIQWAYHLGYQNVIIETDCKEATNYLNSLPHNLAWSSRNILADFVNDLHALTSPTPRGTPLPIVLLGKSKNALLSTFLFLDQIAWLGRSGIYKNNERTDLIGRISLFCWMGSSICTTLVELAELGRLSSSMKKIEKDIKGSDKYQNELYCEKLKKSNDRTLALVKASIDIVVAVGLLQLAPKTVNARVTGGFGFVSSLISCYQLLPAAPKSKTP